MLWNFFQKISFNDGNLVLLFKKITMCFQSCCSSSGWQTQKNSNAWHFAAHVRRWLGRSVRYLWGFPGQPPVLAVEAAMFFEGRLEPVGTPGIRSANIWKLGETGVGTWFSSGWSPFPGGFQPFIREMVLSIVSRIEKKGGDGIDLTPCLPAPGLSSNQRHDETLLRGSPQLGHLQQG